VPVSERNWRWKSRPRGGRPKTPLEIRHLVREMSLANPLWGAPRIHGELLKLGIHLLRSYTTYYSAARTHLSLNKDVPSLRTIHPVGRILLRHFLADFIIGMCEFDVRQAQGLLPAGRLRSFRRRLCVPKT
jgi:hypothetical protein